MRFRWAGLGFLPPDGSRQPCLAVSCPLEPWQSALSAACSLDRTGALEAGFGGLHHSWLEKTINVLQAVFPMWLLASVVTRPASPGCPLVECGAGGAQSQASGPSAHPATYCLWQSRYTVESPPLKWAKGPYACLSGLKYVCQTPGQAPWQ